MGAHQRAIMSRASRWSTAPSASGAPRLGSSRNSLLSRGTVDVGPRASDYAQPLPRSRVQSRFDTQPAQVAAPPQAVSASPSYTQQGGAERNIQPVQTDRHARPSIGASTVSVDLIRNQEGEEEREQWKSQLESQAASRNKDFESRLASLANVASPNRNSFSGGSNNQHDEHVRDRLSSLQMRFDSALRK